MKYIRTKDGIYEYEKMRRYYYAYIPRSGCSFFDEDIIKQANTIEELCDKWVLIDKTGFNEPYVCDTYRESKELKENDDDLMGAIWTEWGLKYVAKLNDEKGDLELL